MKAFLFLAITIIGATVGLVIPGGSFIPFASVVTTGRCHGASGIMIPYPGDCKKFIACVSEHGEDQDCPAGLEFSPKTHTCESPLKAECINPGKPCAGLLGRMVPHPLNCNRFYSCTSDEGILMQCEPGQHFNRWLQMCDNPFSANCIVR